MKNGISAIHIDELDHSITSTTDLLIITIPPSRGDAREIYPDVVTEIATLFNPKSKVIFTGSTGIYPQADGRYTEEYEFDETGQNSHLYQAEKGLRKLLGDRLTILRLGGLIGPGRHPIRSLSGRTMSTSGNAPVNLVDSRDIVRLVNLTIEEHIFGELLNVCFPILMTKKDYYEMIADRLQIEPPDYTGNTDEIRLVDASKVIRKYGFQFTFPITDYTSDF